MYIRLFFFYLFWCILSYIFRNVDTAARRLNIQMHEDNTFKVIYISDIKKKVHPFSSYIYIYNLMEKMSLPLFITYKNILYHLFYKNL